MDKLYLNVPFKEKDQAKSLGARFDWDAKLWYVQPGTDLTVFNRWLTPELQQDLFATQHTGLPIIESNSNEIAIMETVGISLSQLMHNVASAVHQVYSQGVWTVVEIIEIHARGHVYLEVSERDTDGIPIAKARAMIWRSTADKILPEFEATTGVTLGAGIKILVLAMPQFHAQYGFSLQIQAIDAKYTLGHLEAKRREIRARLQSEGVYDNNRSLSAPWDFYSVLVIAPHQAAGLGDFEQEAKRLQLHGICSFHYAYSRFQGQGAAREIASVIEHSISEMTDNLPDVVVIIRGGGSVGDLAWLDDYDLSRTICDLNIPVFTGIGHQRDNTIADEVAHTKFDTPSKVIAGIEHRIIHRTKESAAFVQAIFDTSKKQINQARNDCLVINDVVTYARQQINTARMDCLVINNIVSQAKYNCQTTRADINNDLNQVVSLAKNNIQQCNLNLDYGIQNIFSTTQMAITQSKRDLLFLTKYTFESIYNSIVMAKTGSQGLIREIMGQGPDKTLKRGFTITRDVQNRPVTSCGVANAQDKLMIQFKDGEIPVYINEKL